MDLSDCREYAQGRHPVGDVLGTGDDAFSLLSRPRNESWNADTALVDAAFSISQGTVSGIARLQGEVEEHKAENQEAAHWVG